MKITNRSRKIIGILGGMGPQASAEFYRMLVDESRIRYGARHNDEYPEILLDSIPVPDGFSDPKSMETVASMLENRVQRLTRFGVGLITMACNTVCVFTQRLQRKTPVKIVSVVDEMVNTIKPHDSVLLLSSTTSLRLKLYQHKLVNRGIRYIHPHESDYDLIDALISGVLQGADKRDLQKDLMRLTMRILQTHRVGAVLLGCTELPLIFPQRFFLPVRSSLSVLTRSVLKQYYNEEDSYE